MLLLTRLRFSGFRSYPGILGGPLLNELPLRPLTLLIGRNGSGKSQALRLLHQALAGLGEPTASLLPSQSGDRVFALSPEDNFHFRSPAHPLSVDLGWSLNGVTGSLEFGLAAPSPLNATSTITVLNWRLTQGDHNCEGMDENLPWDQEPWKGIRSELSELWNGSTALVGNRSPIQRAYSLPQQGSALLGLRGERCAEWLFRSPALQEHVRTWLQENLPPTKLELESSRGELRLFEGAGDSQLNLAEAPEGVHQILPVATLLFARSMDADAFIDTIEQPELHLHDAMHGALGDLLLDAAGLRSADEGCDHGQRLMVETHSEGLLLRIRRRIAEGKINAKHIGLAFVDRDERKSHLREIALSAEGDPAWWPDNIFLERLREAQAISIAIRSRRNTHAV